MHLKLNEPIVATKGASNRFINAQDFTEEEARTIVEVAVLSLPYSNLGMPPCPYTETSGLLGPLVSFSLTLGLTQTPGLAAVIRVAYTHPRTLV